MITAYAFYLHFIEIIFIVFHEFVVQTDIFYYLGFLNGLVLFDRIEQLGCSEEERI